MTDYYFLEIWIDAREHDVEETKKKLSRKLDKFPQHTIESEVLPNSNATILRVCSENKRAISCCYKLFEWDRTSIYVGRDDLSEETRVEAFPLLADIETSLRRFINRSMTEVIGFRWWETRMPSSIGQKIGDIQNRTGRDIENYPPLDFSFFEDLVKFVTEKVQRWSDEKQITVADLGEALKNSNSLDDLRNMLQEYQKKISLWDDVFSLYFDNQDSWKRLEDDLLKKVIPIRHKVVHHRGFVQEYEIEQLKSIKVNVQLVLQTAKTKLSREARKKAGDKAALIGILQQAVDHLPGNMPEIIKLLYGLDGNHQHTLDEIGDMFGITHEEVEMQHRNALRQLRHLPKIG